MNVVACPSAQTLTQFSLGLLASQHLESVAAHVAACATCESALTDLAGNDDPLVRLVRSGAARGSAANELFDNPSVIARFKNAALSSGGHVPRGLDERLPPALGQYEIIGVLGRGGMGTVYRAFHPRLRRSVAIKTLRATRSADAEITARFHREMVAVGQLQHPHIVQAYDAGEHEGTLYLVMEFLDGLTLNDAVARGGPLPVAEACEVIRRAAVALDYAHLRGTVHRDVKPSNLMLTRDGELKLLDLGLASVAGEHQAPAGNLTQSHILLGTCDFMAPEQWIDPRCVDGRADLYSLGCTLYYLACGKSPFSGASHDTPAKKMLAHTQQDAPALSSRCTHAPAGLCEIASRLLAKNPDARFATAGEVAAAIAPFCDGADLKRLAATRAALPSPTSPPTFSVSTLATAAESHLADTDRSRGQTRPTGGPATVASAHLRGSKPRLTPLRALIALAAVSLVVAGAIVLQIELSKGTLVVELDDPAAKVKLYARGPIGETTLDVQTTGSIRLREGDYELSLPAGENSLKLDREQVTLVRGKPEVVRIVRKVKPTSGHSEQPGSAHAPARQPTKVVVRHAPIELPKGAPLSAAALVQKPAILEGARSWSIETRHPRSPVWAVGFRPDGKQLASGEEAGAVRIWDFPSMRLSRILLGHGGLVSGLAWSPDGHYLVTCSHDTTLRIWDVAAGQLACTFLGHTAEARCITWSPDGTTIASGGSDNVVRLWNVATGEPGKVLAGHTARVTSVGWSPTADVLASGQKQGCLVILWNPISGQSLSRFRVDAGEVWTTQWSPDGKTLAVGNGGQTTWLWDIALGRLRTSLIGQGGNVTSVAWSSDGRRLAVASWGAWMRIWDTRSGLPLHTLVRDDGSVNLGVFAVDWLADSEMVASGERAAGIRVWNAAEGRQFAQVVSPIALRSTEAKDKPPSRNPYGEAETVLIDPAGGFASESRVEPELVAVVLTETGQEVLAIRAFASRYGWQNSK
jgi:serine/threonine protein kinase/WD40 repeat protein